MIFSKDFLKRLDSDRNRIVFARITALQFNEAPIESIEGRVTQGSITLAGNSAVRRTCSLSIVTNDVDVSNYTWSLNTKFKLEVGLENHVDENYPAIIWFNQGTYLVSSFSAALAANSFIINIQGKDKMCQLNGEIGGTLTSSVDFGKYEQIDDEGNVEYIPQLLKDIIREMVHAYGGEPFHNIIINDLEDKALMMQEYRYEKPLYLLRRVDDTSGEYERATIDGSMTCRYKTITGFVVTTTLDQIPSYDFLAITLQSEVIPPTQIFFDNEKELYCVAKIEYGQTAGFTETDLTYTGDLIANIGETVVSVLDKIKNMLGDFEYFYDIDGRFIFQRQRTYLNTAWTPKLIETEGSGDPVDVINSEEESYTYSLLGNELLISLNNNPNITNLKNDYSVWGTRTAQGASIPVHMRYAIHEKPTIYTTIQVYDEELIEYNKKYHLGLTGQNSKTYIAGAKDVSYENGDKIIRFEVRSEYKKVEKIIKLAEGFKYDAATKTLRFRVKQSTLDGIDAVLCDWRELIYQMALDFKRYNHLDDFQLRVAAANPELFPTGTTGYEQYYLDMDGFWRQLYNQETQYDENYELVDNVKYYKKVDNYKQEATQIEQSGIWYEKYLDANKEFQRYVEELESKDENISEAREAKAAQLMKDIPYNYSIETENHDPTNPTNVSFIRPLEYKRVNGVELYYNAATGVNSLPIYKKAVLSENQSYVPVKYDENITEAIQDLYLKESYYETMSKAELDSLVLFPGENLKNLFIVTDYGLRKDIQDEGEYYIFKQIDTDDYNAYQFYTRTEFEVLDNGSVIEEIVNVPVREAGVTYYSITQVMDLSLIDDNTRLYTKVPYLFYKQINLKEKGNPMKNEYYTVHYESENSTLYDDRDYYEYKGMYIAPELTENNVLLRNDERIIPTYNKLSKLSEYYTTQGKNALFNLCQNDIEMLSMAVKKLLYIQFVIMKNGPEYNETFNWETYENQELLETGELPAKEDYNEYLNTYYITLQALEKKIDDMNTTFDSYAYRSFMSEQEFAKFYNELETYIQSLIDDVQLICQLSSDNKSLDKKYVELHEFLYGPVIKLGMFESKYHVDYPDKAEINSALFKVNQLDHVVLLTIKDIITKTQSFKNRISTLQGYMDSYDFISTPFFGLVIDRDENEKQKYFHLEPAMCYTVSNDYYLTAGPKQYWHKNVYENPHLLNFWFDFLDTQGELGRFAVQTIGSRQKVVNDNTVKSIYYRTAPLVIYSSEGEEQYQTGYKYINKIEGLPSSLSTHKIIKNSLGNPVSEDGGSIEIGTLGYSDYKIRDPYDKKEYLYWRYEEFTTGKNVKTAWRGQEYNGVYSQLFSVSAQGKSAKDAIDNLLYTHSYCIESVSMTAVPIYHLQPNTRIYAYDKESGVEGEFIVTQLTVPLIYNGTMNITATKAVDRII